MNDCRFITSYFGGPPAPLELKSWLRHMTMAKKLTVNKYFLDSSCHDEAIIHYIDDPKLFLGGKDQPCGDLNTGIDETCMEVFSLFFPRYTIHDFLQKDADKYIWLT